MVLFAKGIRDYVGKRYEGTKTLRCLTKRENFVLEDLLHMISHPVCTIGFLKRRPMYEFTCCMHHWVFGKEAYVLGKF